MIQEKEEFHSGFKSDRKVSHAAFAFHQSLTKATQKDPLTSDSHPEQRVVGDTFHGKHDDVRQYCERDLKAITNISSFDRVCSYGCYFAL